MSKTLNVHEDLVSEMIADWASRLYIDAAIRAEQKARNAAQEMADEVGILAAMTLPKRREFANITGHRAARNVRTYK